MASAWNLGFEVEGGLAHSPESTAVVPRPEYAPSGWAGSAGPGIAWKHWPRHRETQLPLMHVLTMYLPTEYQRKGPEFPGVAVFYAGGEGGEEQDRSGAEWAAFEADAAAAQEHPMLSYRLDLLEGPWALVWLSAEELAAGPTPPAPDPRPASAQGEPEYANGANAWDNLAQLSNVWLLHREDPNAGIPPEEYPGEESAYRDPHGDDNAWSDGLFPWAHLGGTMFNVQGMPDDFSPWYLEFAELNHVNLGGDGTVQIDLDGDGLDWACG